MLLEIGIASVVLVVIWKLNKPKPKKKELAVEDVLKAADDALAFDPLKDVKERPKAIQPLLSVLLAIREKKAEKELVEEERERKYGGMYRGNAHIGLGAGALLYGLYSRQNEDKQRRTDVLGGVIGPDHPHWKYTEAGHRAAQQDMEAEQMKMLRTQFFNNSPPDLRNQTGM